MVYATPLGLRFFSFGSTNISHLWRWGWAEPRPSEVRNSGATGFTRFYQTEGRAKAPGQETQPTSRGLICDFMFWFYLV